MAAMRWVACVGLIIGGVVARSAQGQGSFALQKLTFEHAVQPRFPLATPFLAAELFASNDAGTLRLRGHVAKATTSIFAPKDKADATWTASGSITFEFDEHGNITMLLSVSSEQQEQLPPIQIKNVYELIDGTHRRIAQTSDVGHVPEFKVTYEYNDSGVLIGSTSGPHRARLDRDADGRPASAALIDQDQTWAYHFDAEGRLKEQESGASRSTVEWKSPTEFVITRPGGEKADVQSAGTLDQYGSLLRWSYRKLLVGGPLVNAHNQITYDDQGNWTEIVTYVEAEPGEKEPSRPVIKYIREITYR